MAYEDKIVNKIITIETIKEIAGYLEDQKDEYIRLFENEKDKNINLKYREQVYKYKGGDATVQYTIRFKDGKEISENNYNWFLGMLNKIKDIDKVKFSYSIYYASNYQQNNYYEYMRIKSLIIFEENTVYITVHGENTEDQTYRLHSYIRGMLENNEDRYNKTVKNRNFRIQSFCFAIGFILSYFIYFILIINKTKIPENIRYYMNNKYILILGQWIVSGIIGNLLGYPIIMHLYRNIIPKIKYSHYSKASHKSIYIDNIEDFISHNEVQIGKFVNNGKNRKNIEIIYKITNKIILLQLVISIIFFAILK